MSNTQLAQPFNMPPHQLQQLMQQIMQTNAAQLQAPHLAVEFFIREEPNAVKSELMGRPIFENREMVRIRWAGDNKRVHVAPANEKYKRDPRNNQWLSYKDTFPMHYDAFKKNADFIGEGTPVSELPFLTEASRAELRALNIHSAEALATLEGAPLKMLGPQGRNWKIQATAYLSKATDMSALSGVVAENKVLREKIEAMEAEVRAFMNGERANPTHDSVDEARLASPLPPDPVELPPEAEAGVAPNFATWSDAELKDFIRDRVGKRPPGTPKHEDLINWVMDLWTQEQAAA